MNIRSKKGKRNGEQRGMKEGKKREKRKIRCGVMGVKEKEILLDEVQLSELRDIRNW
jgi:hypothetical protein